jgi:target of rapamycin complex subunit LST8
MSLEGHTNNVTGIAFNAESKWMATSSEDRTVKIWDLRAANVPQRDFHHGNPVNDVIVHPNQGEVISCDLVGAIKVWDLAEDTNTHTLIPEEEIPVTTLTAAQDGDMLVAGNKKVLFIPSNRFLSTGKCVCLENVIWQGYDRTYAHYQIESP